MSIALQLLIGGALFLVAFRLFDTTGVVILGAALFGLELIHDLRLYRSDRRG